MYEGYLEFGGNEIINSARSVGYMESSHCAVSWLRCPPCPGIDDAVNGSEPYIIEKIQDAPWYDYRAPASTRFLGVHGLGIDGLPGSTREAEIAEGIMDGGVVGKPRHATRRMRVRAILSAQGEDALEYGLSWLEAALTPGRCGEHGDACGSADARLFTACPPTRAEITSVQTIWNDPVTNLALNPSFEAASGGVVSNVAPSNAAQATAAQTTDTPAHGSAAIRYTLTTAGAIGLPVIDFSPVTGTTYTLIGKVRPVTRDTPLAPRIRGTAGPVIVAPVGVWTPFYVSVPAGSGAVGQTGLLIASNAGHAIGDIVDIDEVLVVEGSYSGPYFDGDSPDSPPTEVVGANVGEFAWTGTPKASTSTGRRGQVLLAPDPVGYQQVMFRLARNLHGVTCVSGPTVEEKLHRGDAWGYIVEFVLVAAVPFMFSETRPVTLEPSTPVVIQDVPFNLVPYPSAELALGTVIAATNFSTNPSVEVDATDWVKSSGGVLSADVVGARSTELAAQGGASFKSRLTATNSGSSGSVETRLTVAFPTQPAGTRMSVNQWQSAFVVSGTAVLTKIEVYIEWLNGTTSLGTILIGEVPPSGGAISGKSLLVPATANGAYVRARARLSSWSTGAVVDLYADAAAVTVP